MAHHRMQALPASVCARPPAHLASAGKPSRQENTAACSTGAQHKFRRQLPAHSAAVKRCAMRRGEETDARHTRRRRQSGYATTPERNTPLMCSALILADRLSITQYRRQTYLLYPLSLPGCVFSSTPFCGRRRRTRWTLPRFPPALSLSSLPGRLPLCFLPPPHA